MLKILHKYLACIIVTTMVFTLLPVPGAFAAACTHTRHANDTYYSTDYEDNGSSTSHTRIDYYRHSCTDCGASLPNVSNKTTESHTFSGSTCTRCGYTKQITVPGSGQSPIKITSEVAPGEGLAGSQFTFTAKVSNKPERVYIQFDNGQGGWLNKDTCKSVFAMQLQNPSSGNEATYTLAKTINTPGQPSAYHRKCRVWAENTAGEAYIEDYIVVKESNIIGPQVKPLVQGVDVLPERGYQGQNFVFTARVSSK